MMKKLLMLAIVTLCLSSCMRREPLSIYISPTGVDTNVGDETSPLKSVEAAQRLAESHFGKCPVEFVFMDGVHYLTQSITINPEQSGTKRNPVTYKAQNSGKAVISGGKQLHLSWKPYRDGIYKAKINDEAAGNMDQLYVNGKRRVMARYPNVVEGKSVFDCWDLSRGKVKTDVIDMFDPRVTSRWADPTGAYIHGMHHYLWGDKHWIVTGKNADGELEYEGGWQNNRPSPMHSVYRIIENVFEELDAPNEWFYDKGDDTLYFYPAEGEDITSSVVEVVLLPNLIKYNGNRINNITYTDIEGLVFRHAYRTFMDNREPLLRSDWTICREAAVSYNGAVDCQMRDCEFDQVGGNTVLVNNYNKDLLFYGCYIHDSGANGFAFIGDPSTVRSPLFRYGKQDYENMDRTPGPKWDNFPTDCVVDNCLIVRTGRVEKQTAPVQISMSYGIVVSNCSIYDVPRAGINVSEGTFGGHVIDKCDIFDTVLETGDHGSFNSWGRDRFWTPSVDETTEAVLPYLPEMPLYDMLGPITISNSRFRCDHGWDIDLDDGSSNYIIKNNLLLNGGLKLREGYFRTAVNNILINSSFTIHHWFGGSDDIVKNNIVMGHHRYTGPTQVLNSDVKWGKEIDYNFFMAGEESRLYCARHDCDANSLSGDPLFVDPASGNFRVGDDSPALKVGFKNIQRDVYGVTIPKLRAIARTPEIPEIVVRDAIRMIDAVNWDGNEIKSITTLNEQSAIGIGGDRGGVLVLSIDNSSELVKSGLAVGDAILAINGEDVGDIDDLLALVKRLGVGSYDITIRRNQENSVLSGVKITNKGADIEKITFRFRY